MIITSSTPIPEQTEEKTWMANLVEELLMKIYPDKPPKNINYKPW
jgi:hypothetical protein